MAAVSVGDVQEGSLCIIVHGFGITDIMSSRSKANGFPRANCHFEDTFAPVLPLPLLEPKWAVVLSVLPVLPAAASPPPRSESAWRVSRGSSWLLLWFPMAPTAACCRCTSSRAWARWPSCVCGAGAGSRACAGHLPYVNALSVSAAASPATAGFGLFRVCSHQCLIWGRKRSTPEELLNQKKNRDVFG